MNMQAVEITTPGGPEVLRLTRRPVPVPGDGEVLIRVAAFGLNRPDIAQRQGKYPVPAGVTDIPGLEVSGEIIGGDLTHPANYLGLSQGDRVCALVQGGGYAEYCVAPIAQCLPYPAGFDHVLAAALPEMPMGGMAPNPIIRIGFNMMSRITNNIMKRSGVIASPAPRDAMLIETMIMVAGRAMKVICK